jgi:hypothetical protein
MGNGPLISDPTLALPVRLSNGTAFYVAGSGGGGAPYGATPRGYQQITGMSAATALTPPGGATFAVVTAEGVDVRWRDDGVAPTATVGMLLYAGNTIEFSGDLATVQFIQTAAGSILNVSYYS